MGLDMYLKKHTYVKNWDHEGPELKKTVSVKLGGKKYPGIQPKRICRVVEEIAYWRKANHIHAWFVSQVQDGNDDCREYEVSVDQLKALVAACRLVVDSPERGPATLPTQSGFFFGSTHYDEWYVEDCKETIKMLEPEIAAAEEVEQTRGLLSWYTYQSSW